MTLKKIILSIFLLLIFFTVNAQEWVSNFETAKEIASKENKKIILVFQGSDWCAPCIKLDKEIWSTPDFKNYAKEHFVLVKADFPRKKKNKLSEVNIANNKKLMELYNKNGYFPFVVIFDKNAKTLGNTGYKKTTPSEYIKILTSF